ncbi:DUF3107 domain-containing protein [Nocardioides rotundus]|uniref:DUF3107 domain-containing protein n=1 Tax=Nocardioides rotundus TaxID=1774216 RepID=UPI001CBE37B0|nr:DUF3107 domain-containing protein [Nocardioides rotundus]UAL28592.1 DUF3107 domain-containing protein [Nocardioides rotundus]
MEVKIGVQHAPRELLIESGEDQETVEKQVVEALASDGQVLALTDSKGRRIVVPGNRIAYVEIGGGVSGNVGFR